MNSLLMKYRPKDMEPAKWKELWANSHPQLQPLADVLRELMAASPLVKPDDFDCPNHYAKLVAQESRKAAFQYVLDLLPDSVDK